MLSSFDPQILEEINTNTGESLLELTQQQPVLLIFLRHFGCTFCREALSDVSRIKDEIESKGTLIVFVHMSTDEIAEKYFQRFNLLGAKHISDPDCDYYKAFSLVKGNFTQLFGLRTWIRGFQAGVVDGHGIGGQLGDGFQMPGVFVLRNGEIRSSFIHKLASDRPNYTALVESCSIA